MQYLNYCRTRFFLMSFLAAAIVIPNTPDTCQAQILNGSFENEQIAFGGGFPGWNDSSVGGAAISVGGGFTATDGSLNALLFASASDEGSFASVTMSQVFALDNGDQLAFDFGWSFSDDIGTGNSGAYQIALLRESDLSTVFSIEQAYQDTTFVGINTASDSSGPQSFQSAPLAAGNYRIEFTNEANGGQSFEIGTASGVQATFELAVDNVRVVSVPEPSGVLVAGVVLAPLLLRRRVV
jgi:hypothetical protein